MGSLIHTPYLPPPTNPMSIDVLIFKLYVFSFRYSIISAAVLFVLRGFLALTKPAITLFTLFYYVSLIGVTYERTDFCSRQCEIKDLSSDFINQRGNTLFTMSPTLVIKNSISWSPFVLVFALPYSTNRSFFFHLHHSTILVVK